MRLRCMEVILIGVAILVLAVGIGIAIYFATSHEAESPPQPSGPAKSPDGPSKSPEAVFNPDVDPLARVLSIHRGARIDNRAKEALGEFGSAGDAWTFLRALPYAMNDPMGPVAVQKKGDRYTVLRFRAMLNEGLKNMLAPSYPEDSVYLFPDAVEGYVGYANRVYPNPGSVALDLINGTLDEATEACEKTPSCDHVLLSKVPGPFAANSYYLQKEMPVNSMLAFNPDWDTFMPVKAKNDTIPD